MQTKTIKQAIEEAIGTKPRLLLFSCSVLSSQADLAVDLPAHSHIGAEFSAFQEKRRHIFFKAKNRTVAARQLRRAGLSSVRDLDGGQYYKNL